MELFEEALQKWEQALSVGQRGDSSSTPTPGDSLRNPETASEVLSEVGGPLLCLSELPAVEEVGGGLERQPAAGGRVAAWPCARQSLVLGGSFPPDQGVDPARSHTQRDVPSTCPTLRNCPIIHGDDHTPIPTM